MYIIVIYYEYNNDFAKPKIVWGNLSLNGAFAHAPAGMFINAPCVMITPFSNGLLAVLNSQGIILSPEIIKPFLNAYQFTISHSPSSYMTARQG